MKRGTATDIEELFEKLKGGMCDAPFVELSYENMADAAKGIIKVMENYKR